jgi:hypothetical protein
MPSVWPLIQTARQRSWTAGMAVAFTALGVAGVSRRAGEEPQHSESLRRLMRSPNVTPWRERVRELGQGGREQ